jgi:hypothetical protein
MLVYKISPDVEMTYLLVRFFTDPFSVYVFLYKTNNSHQPVA